MYLITYQKDLKCLQLQYSSIPEHRDQLCLTVHMSDSSSLDHSSHTLQLTGFL